MEEASATRARVHEDTFRAWMWRVLPVISNEEFASVTRDHVASFKTIFRLILTVGTRVVRVTLYY